MLKKISVLSSILLLSASMAWADCCTKNADCCKAQAECCSRVSQTGEKQETPKNNDDCCAQKSDCCSSQVWCCDTAKK